MISAGRPLVAFRDHLEWAIERATDIIDIGTNQRFAKELRPLEGLFAGKRYRASGYAPERTGSPYDCDLHIDACDIALPDESVDCVICIEVLEHLADPFRSASELLRILRPGGRLFLTVPFLTGFYGHVDSQSGSHRDFPDYWRFTHQGLQKLFAPLGDLRVTPLDGPIEFRVRSTPLARFVDAFPLRQVLDTIDRPRPGKATTRHVVVGEKLALPCWANAASKHISEPLAQDG